MKTFTTLFAFLAAIQLTTAFADVNIADVNIVDSKAVATAAADKFSPNIKMARKSNSCKDCGCGGPLVPCNDRHCRACCSNDCF
jgi:hypothetical protein